MTSFHEGSASRVRRLGCCLRAAARHAAVPTGWTGLTPVGGVVRGITLKNRATADALACEHSRQQGQVHISVFVAPVLRVTQKHPGRGGDLTSVRGLESELGNRRVSSL